MIKLNLGCNDLPLEGFINIDIRKSPEVKADLIADALDLSEHFQKDTVDEIYAGHLIEHLTPEEARIAVAHWYDLLGEGGILAVMTPDFRCLCEEYLQGSISLEDMNNIYIFSYCQDSVHKSIWDQEALFSLLAEAGLKQIEPIDRQSNKYTPYGVEWQVGARGVK